MTTLTNQMSKVYTLDELHAVSAPARAAARSIAFVPTMGALHDGHAQLIRTARAEHDVVVVSCYINPRQFGPSEDLNQYPRTPERDARIAHDAGADVLWLPTDEVIYGDSIDVKTAPAVGAIGDVLEGASRPGHFDGVVGVVNRLLAAVEPDALYLGEKDYQQLVVLRRLVDQLETSTTVRAVPTVRDADGLARSSRNAYLTPAARTAALAIPRSLHTARALFAAGERDRAVILTGACEELAREPSLEVDYVALADPRTLEPCRNLDHGAVLLVAARVDGTRLIDNVTLVAPAPTQPEVSP